MWIRTLEFWMPKIEKPQRSLLFYYEYNKMLSPKIQINKEDSLRLYEKMLVFIEAFILCIFIYDLWTNNNHYHQPVSYHIQPVSIYCWVCPASKIISNARNKIKSLLLLLSLQSVNWITQLLFLLCDRFNVALPF